MACTKVFKPQEHGGLGLISIYTLNEAFNVKLCLDILKSYGNWALLLKARVLRKGTPIKYHIAFSIWSSIKNEMECVTSNDKNWFGEWLQQIFLA